MKFISIILLAAVFVACASQPAPRTWRMPAQFQPRSPSPQPQDDEQMSPADEARMQALMEQWERETQRVSGTFSVRNPMQLQPVPQAPNTPQRPSAYGAVNCVHDQNVYCTATYSINLAQRNNCMPTGVGRSLTVVSHDPQNPAFLDENGYLVGVMCLSRQTQQPVDISPDTLYNCGFFARTQSAPQQPYHPPQQPQGIRQ